MAPWLIGALLGALVSLNLLSALLRHPRHTWAGVHLCRLSRDCRQVLFGKAPNRGHLRLGRTLIMFAVNRSDRFHTVHLVDGTYRVGKPYRFVVMRLGRAGMYVREIPVTRRRGV